MKESMLKWGAALGMLVASAMFWACSDDKSDVAGGASGDMGIVAKDIAGLAQKGPFVKGSAVTIRGIDCKTLELSDEIFESEIKSDKGDFAFDDVTLSSTCALFEVTGEYRSEITGKKSAGEITLHALTDLKDRKNVNINVLTELEYERLMYLVTEKGKKFADAKERAEKEVLAAFGIDGDFDNSEDLTIFESGDGNAALLAVSVLMQVETDDADLAKRIEKFADSFAETGEWKDDKTKSVIEEWQVAATADGTLDSIRKNVEGWGYADVVPAFEKYIEVFGDTVILSSDSREGSSSSSEPAEGSFTDSRDGKTYKTVKIGNQIWMAENLNFETDSSYCYNDSAEYCAKYGRLYEWSAAMDACPSGWHLPDTAEWRMLLAAVGGDSIAGMKLKSTSGWNSDGNGTDDFGFTVLPAGGWDNKMFEGEAAGFWSSVGYGNYAAAIRLLADAFAVRLISGRTYVGHSVRCVKDSEYDATANTLKDLRDGKVYRTVTIGNQIWMAENLNYKTDSSFCYNDSAEYCAKYGRLYIWDAAMDACPDGWHLPDSTEWNTLFSAVGGKSTAGEVLKSTSGWVGNKGEATNGTDNYGFAALPAGFRDERGGLFSREGGTAKFWSSTERSSDMATNIILYYYFDVFEASGRHDAMSVRCLNDDTAVPPSSSSSKPVEKSSSSAKADGSEYDATANTLKDLRDGKVYRTMQLGVQTWMAENLNFETKGSLCYHDSAEYCAKYGRLYPWSVAMDSMGIWGANGKGCGFGSTCPSKYPVRGVCPSGWHVPTQMDWTVLFEEVGGSSIAGKVLKSISGWSGRGDNTGTDDFGFSALPAGHYTSVEGLDGKAGTVAFFASSTERDKNSSYYVYLDYKDEARFSNCDETAGLSVRCVMDDDGSISPSSSSGNSSSSELKREQCDVDTDGNCFKDERDGQTYRTVIIGTQTWMAENLNYAYTGVPYKYENDASDSISWCYGNDPAYCAKYGRLYTWAAAMDSVGAWTENSKGCGYGKACSPTYPVQGVCPSGWHLPTEEEFRTLFTTVGGDSIAGAMLKTTSGWNRSGNGATGMDGYSFAALPSGYRENDGVYYAKGGYAYFWTSSVMIDNYVHSVILIYNNDNAILNGHPMFSIHSVRCIKD